MLCHNVDRVVSFTIIVVNIVSMQLSGNMDKMTMIAIIVIDVCND